MGMKPRLKPVTHRLVLRFDNDQWKHLLKVAEAYRVEPQALFTGSLKRSRPIRDCPACFETFELTDNMKIPDHYGSLGAFRCVGSGCDGWSPWES